MVAPLLWFIVLQGLGLIAFPLAFRLFHRLPDRGYTLAKPLALVLFSYAAWLLGLSRLAPVSQLTLVALVAAGIVLSAWLSRRQKAEIIGFVRADWRMLLAAEAVFLAFFLFWLAIVADTPEINHTEKPMDLAFLNAVLHSTAYPPEDPWLAGHPISYYYFGHFMVAAVAKLTATAGAVAYNLGMASIPALAAIGVFGLAANLVRLAGGHWQAAAATGILAVFLLAMVSNLAGFLELVHVRGWAGGGFWDWLAIKGLTAADAGAGGVFPETPWWWWRATRVIDTLRDGQSLDYTITEFPFFSFALGDLHPHVLSLPFLALFLGAVLNLTQSKEPPGLLWARRYLVELAAVALPAGALAFINTWDLPVFVAILAVAVFVKSAGHTSAGVDYRWPDLGRAATRTAGLVIPALIASVALFLPFYWSLDSQAAGVLPVTGPGSRPILFLLAMGLPVTLAGGFALKQWGSLPIFRGRNGPAMALFGLVCIGPLLLWALAVVIVPAFVSDPQPVELSLVNRLLVVGPLLALAWIAGVSALLRAGPGKDSAIAFPLVLAAAGFYLLAMTELFFLADFFGNRMNTVFKLYYQCWFLLTIAGAWGVYYWVSRPKSLKLAGKMAGYGFAGLIAAMVMASLYYPVGMIADRTGIGSDGYRFTDKTLDGLAFVQRSDPGEYAAITWFNAEAGPGRIVEAVGPDYSDYGRVSSATGRATILGWPGHEQQWRGNVDFVAERTEDARLIYESGDAGTVLGLLDQYEVRYVFVGRRERQTYGGGGLTSFEEFMTIAFASDGVVVYERADVP